MPNYPLKLPSSSIRAAPRAFWAPTPEFWEALTPHVGDLQPEQREELTEIIERYVRGTTFEQKAPTASEAVTRIAKLRSAADRFGYVLDISISAVRKERTTTPSENEETPLIDEATHFVEGLLNDYFELRDDSNPLRITQISMMISEFIQACDFAERQINEESRQHRSFKRGNAWGKYFTPPLAAFWINQLGRGPIRIRKDTDLHDVESEIPFVAFARAIEDSLPAGFRRPSQGDSADAYRAAVSNADRGRDAHY